MHHLFLQQTTPSTCSLPPEHLSQHPGLLLALKQHQASWDSPSKTYQIPINQLPSLQKIIASLKPRVYLREPPLTQINQLLSMNVCKKGTAESMIQDRLLIYDPQLRRMFYLQEQLSRLAEKSNKWRHCLLVGSKHMASLWEAHFSGSPNLTFRNLDVKSLHPDFVWKIKGDSPKEQKIYFLPYEHLADIAHLLTKSTLGKYDCLVCDDSEMWIYPQEDINLPPDLQPTLKKIIGQFGEQKALYLLAGRLTLDVDDILTVGSVLQPHHFGTDPFKIAKGTQRSALWMRPRYKAQKFNKQLHFILKNTILVNLIQRKGPTSDINWLNVTHKISIREDQKQRIKEIDGRHRNIDRKGALALMQEPQNIKAPVQTGLAEESYIRELRTSVQREKEGATFHWIKYWVISLRRRVAVVVETTKIQERMERFLKEEHISFQVYEIKFPSALEKVTTAECSQMPVYEAMVCLIVRQKFVSETRAYRLEQESRRFPEGEEHYSNINRSIPEQTDFDSFELPRLSNYLHIVLMDIFWYHFDSDKERALMAIFGQLSGKEQGVGVKMEDLQGRTRRVAHHFIFSQGTQQKILKKYLSNVDECRQQVKSSIRGKKGIPELWAQIVEDHKVEGRQTVEGLCDIDEEFDRLQFEARKQKEAQGDTKEAKVSYNTKIEGLVIEASLPKDYKSPAIKQEGEAQLQEIESKRLTQMSWLQDSKSIDSSNQDSFNQKQPPVITASESTTPEKAVSKKRAQSSQTAQQMHRDIASKKVEKQRPVLPFVKIGSATEIPNYCRQLAGNMRNIKKAAHIKRSLEKSERVIRKKMNLRVMLRADRSSLAFL